MTCTEKRHFVARLDRCGTIHPTYYCETCELCSVRSRVLDLGCWISGDCMYYGYTEVSGPDALRYMFSLLGDDDMHAGGAGYGAGTALVCCAAD